MQVMQNEDPSLQAALKKAQAGRGRKVLYLILSVVGVSIIVGAYYYSTRGTDFDESAAAMADPFGGQQPEPQEQDAEPAPAP